MSEQQNVEKVGRYDTPTGEHPAIVAMREKQAEADAQGYTEGDVNHYIQPLIGHLRLLERDGKPLRADDLAYFIDRMHKACNAELAWLSSTPGEPADEVLGVYAPRCYRCNWQAIDRQHTEASQRAVLAETSADVAAHKAECPALSLPSADQNGDDHA